MQYPDDALEWHDRVLLRRFREGVWLVLTPDLSVEVADLGETSLFPLVRGGAVRAAVQGRRYLLAADAAAALPAMHVQAARFAAILGSGPAVGLEGIKPVAS